VINFSINLRGWLVIALLITNQSLFSQMRDTVTLSEVVVTGELKPVLADRSLYQIKSISAREIRGRGATTLSELLSNELSFRISQDAALGSSLKLNGMSGEHVKILVDGIPLVGRQAGILDLSQINLFKVDHIEVVEGPMSVIYGSNALGGVINIITKKQVYGNRSLYKIRTYYQSVGVYNADADFTFHKDQHTLNSSFGRHFFGGYSAPNDIDRSQTWKPKLQWNGNLDYSFKTTKYILNIGSSLFFEELRNKGNPIDDPEKALDEYHYTTRSLNKIDFTAPIFNKLNTTVLASYSFYNKRKITNVKNLVTLDEFPYIASSQDTTRFGNFLGRWMVGGMLNEKMELQSGAELNREDGLGKRIGGEKSMTEYAGFTSLKYEFLKAFNAQAGLRYLYNNKFDAPIVYSFNTMWDVNSKAKIRFSLGKGFRAPSLKEMYFEFIDINHHVLGNATLQPEESFYLGLNSDIIFNTNLNLNFGIFQNSIENKIDLLYNSKDASKAQYFNLSNKKTIIKGAKFMLNINISDNLKFQTGSQLTGLSKITESDKYNWSADASFNSTYYLQKAKAKASVYYKYNGKYVFYTASYNEIGTLSSINENFLNHYNVLDVIVTKWLFDDQLELSLGVKNLFNNINIIGKGSSGPHGGGEGANDNPVGWGRTFFIQMQFNLSHDGKISEN